MSFVPKIYTVLKDGYSKKQFSTDVMSGIIVGVIALPLAIAFAIASGVTPEKGLYTAIVAGFIISVMGGSRVQIGGPTGAFIVIVFDIVNRYGVDGLTIATFMAGFMIVLMGITRLGSIIKFIPYSLVVGFTSGIALIIFSSQLKDFFGFQVDSVPADFLMKWKTYFTSLDTINYYALGIGVFSFVATMFMPRLTSRIPGSLVAIIVSTLAVMLLQLPVETIESRFGEIPSTLPVPGLPDVDWEKMKELFQPAFTIAMLGAIESLLSAVVSDGMIGGNHRSNTELVAQGTANVFSALFAGIPATGAIARTATNVKNGGRTPVAGMVHAITLLVIMIFIGKWAKLIPLASLAGILVVVAYNMSEWKSFVSILKGPRSDMYVMLATFSLTVLVDLTVAIEIGIVLACFLFIFRIAKISNVTSLGSQVGENGKDPVLNDELQLPDDVEVYEVNGPLFFGAAYNFKETMRMMHQLPRMLVIRMRYVSIIDATGLHHLKNTLNEFEDQGVQVVLSGVNESVYSELQKAGVVEMLGEKHVFSNIDDAQFWLERNLNNN